MKSKKAIALMISLVLIVGIVLPGTLAISTDQAAANGHLTVANETQPSTPEGTEESAPTEETEPTEVSTPTETEASKECTCGAAEDEGHKEDCPLYVTPEMPTAPSHIDFCSDDCTDKGCKCPCHTANGQESVDFSALYDRLIAAETANEFYKLFDALPDEEVESFRVWLIENGCLEALEAHLGELETVGEPAELPIVSFTNVGPLLAAPVVRAPRAMRAAARGADDSGVVLNKTAKANADGTYTITLEAYATGASSTVVSAAPVDIVLVLDVSGSMDDDMYTYRATYSVSRDNTYYVLVNGRYQRVSYNNWHNEWGYYDGYWFQSCPPKTAANDTDVSHVQFYELVSGGKKIDALKNAVNSFMDNVNAKSPDSSIAIVKFAGNKRGSVGNDTYQDGYYTYNYSQIVRNLTAVGSGLTTLKSAVNGLRPAGATQADYGMEHAQSIINGASNDGRKKVVIMFTDGEPTSGNTFENGVANSAISASKSIKAAGATVYTIGVFSGADGTPVSNLNSVSNTNKYMHLVSSNYKDAASLTDTGNASYPEGGKSYFLSAGSSAELESIFTQISQEVGGSTVKLDGTSYIQDTVTGQFTMPEGTNAVSFYTMDCVGDHRFDANTKAAASGVTYTVTNNTLNVTGFDFSGNWCGPRDGTYGGKKLIVEFTVTSRGGFLGGNGVLTNEGTTDGIYNSDGTSLGGFTSPSVNVPIPDVTVTAKDKNVYLLGNMTADQLKNDAVVKVGDVALDLSKADDADKPYGLEKWQTEYVNITVKVKDHGGNVISDKFENLTDDTIYTVEVTVTPKTAALADSTGSPATEKTGNDSANINVFKPNLTFKDSDAFYGGAVPDFSDNLTNTEWKHGNTLDTAVTMTGDKPELDIACTPDASKISGGIINTEEDIGVDVTVKIGGTDVTDETTFRHRNCTGRNCTLPEGKEFLIHVKSCTLTITKTGWEAIDENQSFLFEIIGDKGYRGKVVIKGSDSVTVKGLKIGTYTVTEVTDWSWRYEPDNGSKSIEMKATGRNEVTFANTRENGKWLGGDAYTKNIFRIGN